jgi:hypothetical protein
MTVYEPNTMFLFDVALYRDKLQRAHEHNREIWELWANLEKDKNNEGKK